MRSAQQALSSNCNEEKRWERNMAVSKNIAIDNYFLFLKNLEDSQKLKLISKLPDSMISDQQ